MPSYNTIFQNLRNMWIFFEPLYGTVGAGVGKYPIVMSLDDMTGKRGMAENYLATIKGAMQGMGIEKGIQVLALTTDNPTVMQSFRRMFQNEFQWVLV